MKNVLLVHGPNLNRLGRRDAQHYGTVSHADLVAQVKLWAQERGAIVRAYQSNHEGSLIDVLQEQGDWAEGALVNLGALSHSSYALHDALLDFGKPVVEVHLSKISGREAWRRVSVTRPACVDGVEGLGPEGYRVALESLLAHLA